MASSPQQSVGIALGTGALVWAVYNSALPPLASVRVQPSGNTALQKSRRTATLLAAGLVGLVYFLTRDPIPVIVGGAVVISEDMAHRHADAVNHVTQTVLPSSSGNGPSSGAQSSGIHSSAAQPGQ
jgi:hypothetical protein